MIWFTCRTAKVACLPIAGLVISFAATAPASAACPTSVKPAESPVGTQTIASGEDCTVLPGARIETTGDSEHGIAADDFSTIVNRGFISTTGIDARGINGEDGNTIVNHGVIATEAAVSQAISVYDENTIINYGTMSAERANVIRTEDSNTIINQGVILANGSPHAVVFDDDNIVTNTGEIRGTGTDTFGLDGSSRNVITNTGTISVTGIGIDADHDNTIVNSGLVEITAIRTAVDLGDGNNVTNTGTIRTTRNYSWGVAVDDDNIINNSGLISTVGESSDAVIVLNGNVITNSGAIVATGLNSSAVHLSQTDNTLNLLQGSRIVGLIEFGEFDGEGNTVKLGRGENWLMTFTEDPTLRNSLDTSGAPTAFLNGGLTVATFDAAATVFGAEASALSDLTGVINATLHHRLTAGNPTTYVWTQGFGAQRNADDDGGGSFQPAAADNTLAGGMAGFSTPLASFARGGLFAGYAHGSLGSPNHEIDQQSWFGGAYGRAFRGQAFADLIVTAGQTDNDSARRILNNMALDGVEFARGGYDGWFVNPELTLGMEMPFGVSSKLVPSASVGYAGLFLDGLTETGSQAAVTLESRDIELINGRLQLEMRTSGETSTGPWQTAVRAGVRGRSSIGDDSLAGVLAVSTAFNVTPEDDDDAVAGFLGADLTFSVASSTQVFAGAETALEDDGDSIFAGRAGLAFKF